MEPSAGDTFTACVRAWLRLRLRQLGGEDLLEEEVPHTSPESFGHVAESPSGDVPQKTMHNIVTMDGGVRRTMTGIAAHPLASPNGGVTSTERIAAQLQRSWGAR